MSFYIEKNSMNSIPFIVLQDKVVLPFGETIELSSEEYDIIKDKKKIGLCFIKEDNIIFEIGTVCEVIGYVRGVVANSNGVSQYTNYKLIGKNRVVINEIPKVTKNLVPQFYSKYNIISDNSIDKSDSDLIEKDNILEKCELCIHKYCKLNAFKYKDIILSKFNIYYQVLSFTLASILGNTTNKLKLQLLNSKTVYERLSILTTLLEEELSSLNNAKQHDNTTALAYTNKNLRFKLFDLNQNNNFNKEEMQHQDQKESLKDKIKNSKMHEEAKELALNELSKTEDGNSMNINSTTSLNFVKTLLSLPWETYSKEISSLKQTKDILDRDHFGLEKIKSRIIEYIAVKQIAGANSKGSILCFNGPPGVGKTSLAKSIAESLGRVYRRISLGGVRDESNIRGHRRTYVGAIPGNIMQAIQKAKVANPVILLDEVDKLGLDHMKGDVESALLEVLDPEQNSTFKDNYIETYFDLSKVFFICTSNNIEKISPPLRDRMEIINLTGYTLKEKLEIAKKYLIPKQIKATGLDTLLSKFEFKFSEKIVEFIIENYTFESGVRNLEQKISAICRYIVKEICEKRESSKDKTSEIMNYELSENTIISILGKVREKLEVKERVIKPGVSIGLAYTEFGGRVILIESSMSKSKKGNLLITGNIKDIMKESVYTSLSWIKSNLGILNPNFKFEEQDIHVHVPEAATPKDGPSAGITICCSLVSLISGFRLRNDIAMTGELSLTGFVLPVGGIKEKILGAYRLGIKTFILSFKNKIDVEEAFDKDNVLKDIKIIYVHTMNDVLANVFTEVRFNPIKGFEFISKF